MANKYFVKHNPSLFPTLTRGEIEFIEKLKYWLERSKGGKLHNGRKWIYNTMQEWAKQIRYSVSHVKRIISKLVKRGILFIEKLNFNKTIRTNYYSLNEETFSQFIEPSGHNELMPLAHYEPMYNTKNNLNPYKLIKDNKDLSKIQDTFIDNNKDLSNTNIANKDKEDVSGKYLSKVEKRMDHSMDEKDKLEAHKMLKIITDKLDHPLEIDLPLTMTILSRRLQTHFGTGPDALTTFKEYCICYANSELLMGKKALRDGKYFKTNIGTILSSKLINDYLERRGFFNFTNLKHSTYERTAPAAAEDQEIRESRSWFYAGKPARERIMPPREYVSPPASPEMEAMFERLGKSLGIAVNPPARASTAPSPSYPRPTYLPKAEGPSEGLKSLLRAQKDYRPPNLNSINKDKGESS